MLFEPALVPATFLRRYKRFFVDARLPDGQMAVAHCPNTGSLLGCLVEGAEVMLEPAQNPTRSLRYSLKMIRIDGTWVGVDTQLANGLVADAIGNGLLPALGGYERIIKEVPYGIDGRSRIDLLLSRGGRAAVAQGKGNAKPKKSRLFEGDERVYVEVKNTTLAFDDAFGRSAAFPDAVTERGKKHLDELMAVVAEGHRAAMVFCVQRDDCGRFVPADGIDAAYGRALRDALRAGVEAFALAASVGPSGVTLRTRLAVVLP